MPSRNWALRSDSHVDHRGPGAALALPEQALVAGQVDEAGVPGVDPHPAAGLGAVLPAGLTAAGLVDAEYPGGFRLAQQLLGVGDEGAVRGRPRHAVRDRDLGHRAGRLPDRRADLGAQPPGGPRPRRICAIASVNEAALAVFLPASPAGLVPPHHDSILAVRDVPRRRRHPALREVENTPHDGHAAAVLLGSRHMHHTHPVRRDARHARRAHPATRTTMSYRRTRPLVPSFA